MVKCKLLHAVFFEKQPCKNAEKTMSGKSSSHTPPTGIAFRAARHFN